jgi:hypothetical protein
VSFSSACWPPAMIAAGVAYISEDFMSIPCVAVVLALGSGRA